MADPMQTPTAAPAAVSPSSSTAPAPAVPTDPNAKNILLAVTYLIPIIFIYTMIKNGDKPYFVWHSKNAAAYLLLVIALTILFNILWSIVPGMIEIMSMLLNLVYLFLFIAVVYFGIVKGSWLGKQTPIPLVTNIGQKLPLEKWFKKGVSPVSAAQAPTAAPSPAPATPAEPAPPSDQNPSV